MPYRNNPILDVLCPDRKARWLDREHRDAAAPAAEIAVESLSFFDRPDEVLDVLHQLLVHDAETHACALKLDMQTVEDLGPLLVLAEIWHELSGVITVGHASSPVRKVMHGTRISNVIEDGASARDETIDVWAFPLNRRHDANSSTSATRQLDRPKRDEVAPRLADQVASWIEAVTDDGITLSEGGNAVLTKLITEILDNAERHSFPTTHDGSWSISAFMVKSGEAGALRFDCHLAFLSFGDSFAESLAHAQDDSRRLVDEYIAQHPGRPGQSKDTLVTLMGLQDWVTGDPKAEDDKRGGLGLMHVLGFVNRLGGGCPQGQEPQLVIVSGNSCVKCRVPYVSPTEDKATMRRTLWFNEQNDPDIAPDAAFVLDLKRKFPGTLISVKFTMNETHLRKLAENGRHDT